MELSFNPSDGEVACIRLTILQKTIINSTQNKKEKKKISLFENTKESPKASKNQREFPLKEGHVTERDLHFVCFCWLFVSTQPRLWNIVWVTRHYSSSKV